jgi:hypothetical protein
MRGAGEPSLTQPRAQAQGGWGVGGGKGPGRWVQGKKLFGAGTEVAVQREAVILNSGLNTGLGKEGSSWLRALCEQRPGRGRGGYSPQPVHLLFLTGKSWS